MNYSITSVPNYKNKWDNFIIYKSNIIEEIVNELNNDRHYHSVIYDNDSLYSFYFDVDRYAEINPIEYDKLSIEGKILRKKTTMNSFKKDIQHLINVLEAFEITIKENDIKYTVNDNYKFGFHISIPKLHGSVSDIKALVNIIYKECFDKKVDMSVYGSRGLYRLPNQSKGNSDKGLHIICNGVMKDFIPEHIIEGSVRIKKHNYVTEENSCSKQLKIEKKQCENACNHFKNTKENTFGNITPETRSDDDVKALSSGYDSFRYCNKKEKIQYMHDFTKIININHIKSYNDWVGVGNMYINELGDDGFPMFLEYCKRDTKGFEQLDDDEYLREAKLRKKWTGFPTENYTGILKTVASLMEWAKEDNPDEYEKIIKKLNKKNQMTKKEEKIAKKEEKIELDAYLLNMKPDSDNFINKFIDDDFTMIKFLRYLDNTIFENNIQAYEYIRDNLHRVCLLTGLETLMTKDDDERVGVYKLKEFPETLIKTEDYDPMDKLTLNKILFNNRNFICRYDKADVYPNDHDCPSNQFNLWKSLYCDTIKEYTEMPQAREFLLRHILIICNNVETSYNYVINWIANMLQRPWEKVPMMLFLSEQGAGKGAFIDLLERLIGSKKFLTSCEPERDVWGSFNGPMVGKLLVHLEELSKIQCKDADHRMKKLTTSGTIEINRKMKDQLTIKSHHKFIISTNKLETVKIEKRDRRFFATKCSDELIGNKDYFIKYYKLIEDPNVIKTMAVYFQSLTVPEIYLSNKIPMTPLKETLMELSKDKYQLWLDNYAIGKSGQIELRTSECYDNFKRFAENNHMAINEVNMVKFGKYLQNNNNVKKGKHTKFGNQIIIDFDAINKELGIDDEDTNDGESADLYS